VSRRRRTQNGIDENTPPPGTVMANKTVFGCEIDDMLIFTAPTDVKDPKDRKRNLLMIRAEALKELDRIKIEGYLGLHDWDLATPAEMQMLVEHEGEDRLSGSFNRASAMTGCYLTSETETTIDPPLAVAVKASDGDTIYVRENDAISVRFVRREKSGTHLEVASTRDAPAKTGKGHVNYRRVVARMKRRPDRTATILSRVLEGMPEQRKLEVLDHLLYEAVCIRYLGQSGYDLDKVVEPILKAGANPNAEFNGVVKGEILATCLGTHCDSSVGKLLYRYGADIDAARYYIANN
jgi:hypothetical protein